jgi:undecaprenyl-diphosphatase
MGNQQIHRSGRKSSGVSTAWLLIVLIGFLLCGLSFLGDQAAAEWVKTHDSRSLKHVAGFLSRWGDWPELMLFGCVGLGLARIAQNRVICKIALSMMIAATISGALVNSVRLLTGRARPNNTEATQEWNGLWRGGEFLLFKSKYHSFPSGHTGTAFAFFGIPLVAHRQHGWWALLVAAAIAGSRVYLNVHHLSDVTTGALIGLITAFFVWERLGPKVERFLGHLFP